MSDYLPFLPTTLFMACMVLATFCDVFTMTIPNKIVLTLVAGFAIFAPFSGLTLVMTGYHVATAAGLLVLCFGFFAAGWMGGGDAKLIAATALWLGPTLAFEFVLFGAVLGGVLTVLIILMRSNSIMLPVQLQSAPWMSRLLTPKGGVPYGAALGPAALLVFPASIWGIAAGL
ncbi:prepilin peptidase [Rhizobiaceae bacterium]|nr:prepilin peptidase [Rhizobiaceae bacterium]